MGVPHEELGQQVKAFVVPAPGAEIDTAELERWVGARLAYFKVPTRWELRSEPMPRNASGKLLKHVVTGDAENPFIEE